MKDLFPLAWVPGRLLLSMLLHPIRKREKNIFLGMRFGPGLFGIQFLCRRPSPAVLNSIFGLVFRTHRSFHTTNGADWFPAHCGQKQRVRSSTANPLGISHSVKRLLGILAFLAVWKSRRKMSRS